MSKIELNIFKSMNISIHCKNLFDIENKLPIHYRIKPIPDAPPRIIISNHNKNTNNNENRKSEENQEK